MSTEVAVAENRKTVSPLLRCWCGAEQWESLFRRPRGGLARCRVCGSYQTDPPPLTDSDESQAFYTSYYAHLEMGARPLRDLAHSRTAGFWKVANQVPALQPPGRAVADIGCGDGHLCAELQAAGWDEVHGVELSEIRVTRARQFYPRIYFYDRPLRDTNVAKGSLDLVVSESTIEHVPEPVQLLQGVRPYLRPGGRIVITTPNLASGHFRLLGKRWTGMLAPHAHIFMFTASSLSLALERAGYRVENAGSFPDEQYSLAKWMRRLFSGDVKGAVWRAHQELGTLYGHLIGQSAMLYAVGVAD